MEPIYDSTTPYFCMLFTSSEYFAATPFHCLKAKAATPDTLIAASLTSNATANVLANATFGATWGFWPFDKDNTGTSTFLTGQVPDQIMYVGTIKGTGAISRMTFTSAAGILETTATLTASTTGIATTATSIMKVDPPTNGMSQFKGLTTSTTQKTYVQVICLGVAPSYATWAIDMNSTSNVTTRGFIVNCYTGIPQCASSLVDSKTYLNTTTATTVVSTCMADPRYLTWRSFILKIQYDGTVNWFRVDSYYN